MQSDDRKVYLKGAFGCFTKEKMIIILKNSVIDESVISKLQDPKVKNKARVRNIIKKIYNLISDNRIALKNGKYVFLENSVTLDPSTSGELILGRVNNGKVEWKNNENKTIKELFY
ncbi:hypothetical protein CJJ23_01125 [Mycoplasmopsis agassizii]|uniref:DUF4357 domain-containing protein n=1 Tax=Mycoplasmopsis agassizii TaxID=33922 RepID=A0A269TKR7_9BACT|nr:DUF4357 domain-containing protein [Mycoplasmopsis agassizii]PAK21538.1 hypothetical protein CJJ23_01125 [Mycoplasmopsis agassizii]